MKTVKNAEQSLNEYTIKYRVVDREFDSTEAAESYARFMTNSVSSKVWISRIVYSSNGLHYCMGSYTL